MPRVSHTCTPSINTPGGGGKAEKKPGIGPRAGFQPVSGSGGSGAGPRVGRGRAAESILWAVGAGSCWGVSALLCRWRYRCVQPCGGFSFVESASKLNRGRRVSGLATIASILIRSRNDVALLPAEGGNKRNVWPVEASVPLW